MQDIFEDVHPRLILFALTQSLLAASPFFGVTVLNVPEDCFKVFMEKSITNHYGPGVDNNQLSWLWSTLVAATTAGPLIGSFLLGYLAIKYGRRDMVMVWNNVLVLISCFFQVIAFPLLSYECLLIGRILNGVCIGMWSFVPVYLAECSPDSCRGLVSMTVGIGRTVWLLLGAVLGLPNFLGRYELLPYLVLIPALPAVLHICLTPMFPKSPKFLFITEQKGREAIDAIRFYHGTKADLPSLLTEYDREAQLTNSTESHREASLFQILRTNHLRWPLFVCVIAVVAVDCSGTDITNQYSNGLLKAFGLNDTSAIYGTIISLIPSVILSMLAPFVVEFFGRRKIVIFGVLCGLFSVTDLFVTGFVDSLTTRNSLAVVGVTASYVGAYIGFGSVSSILPGELAPEGSRSVTVAVASFFTWIPSFIILMVFPKVDDMIGSYSYLPFVFFNLLCGAFLFAFLPETKGRPVDEIIDRWVVRNKSSSCFNESTPLLVSEDNLR